MKKVLSVIGLLSVGIVGTAGASGYRIPEQSVNSTARAGGYVAYTPAADAAYYNPANMAWLDDRGYLEVDATWIRLDAVTYTDHRTSSYNGESEEENFLLPTFFAVSPDYHNFRVGFSLTGPAGLSKQWKQPFPRTFAEEFTLKVYEVNPTLSYKLCDQFSIGGGLRVLYGDGRVKSNGMVASGVTASRSMDGDTWEAGYNLALTARPVENLNVSATYRSKVDLDIEGTADLATSLGPGSYHGDAGVEVLVPAALALAVSYTFFDQLTAEMVYERTYWSDYESLDFTYPVPLGNPLLTSVFDDAKPKNWSDTDSWRFSLTYDFKNSFILMAGFAYDENPIPDEAVNFELPDSNAKLYSLGLRYQVNEDLELGIAYLYDDKETRRVTNEVLDGEFSDASAHLLTFGLSYKL